MASHRGAILLIEDNRDLALGLRVNLEEDGYEVHVASTGAEGLEWLRRAEPDLVILDVGLPDVDGLELLRRLRASGDSTLVLVLTANGRQELKLFGLRGGADDYVTKPFDLEELLARVDVLFRRRSNRPGPRAAVTDAARIAIDDIEIDVEARMVRRNGTPLTMSRLAFDLLLVLAKHRGSVVTRGELMREVWGYGEGVVSRTLDTHIFELRKLVEADPSAPTRIRTVWRIGYRFD